MKTSKVLSKIASLTFLFLFVSAGVFADGGSSEVFVSGKTSTPAGDFVVTGSDEAYHYQGEVYRVYNVYYDNPEHNMKIAVPIMDNCKSYIAYTDDFWFKYECTRHGFGVRKAMFSSARVRDQFNSEEYQNQTVLVKERKIEKDKAVALIAAYLPRLHDSENRIVLAD
jgi:hypothetical protein